MCTFRQMYHPLRCSIHSHECHCMGEVKCKRSRSRTLRHVHSIKLSSSIYLFHCHVILRWTRKGWHEFYESHQWEERFKVSPCEFDAKHIGNTTENANTKWAYCNCCTTQRLRCNQSLNHLIKDGNVLSNSYKRWNQQHAKPWTGAGVNTMRWCIYDRDLTPPPLTTPPLATI